jgi:hypothetical protein
MGPTTIVFFVSNPNQPLLPYSNTEQAPRGRDCQADVSEQGNLPGEGERKNASNEPSILLTIPENTFVHPARIEEGFLWEKRRKYCLH